MPPVYGFYDSTMDRIIGHQKWKLKDGRTEKITTISVNKHDRPTDTYIGELDKLVEIKHGRKIMYGFYSASAMPHDICEYLTPTAEIVNVTEVRNSKEIIERDNPDTVLVGEVVWCTKARGR